MAEDDATGGAGGSEGASAPSASEFRRSLRIAGVMALLFLVVLGLSWEVYPSRADLDRPPVIFMNLAATASGPSLFDTGQDAASQAPHLTQITPEPPGYTIRYGNTVAITVNQLANNRLGLTIDWTYLPQICPARHLADPSCVRSANQRPSAEATVFLPVDATVFVPPQPPVVTSTATGHSDGCSVANHCMQQYPYAGGQVAAFQSVVQGAYGTVGDSSTTNATMQWSFTVALHEPYFEQNGVDALTQLPGVQILNPIDPNASVNVKTTYLVPGFDQYVWGQGPSPSGNIWNVSLDGEHFPVAVGGVNNHAVSQDTLLVFASGALLGIAGAALIESIHEMAGHDGWIRRLQRRRRARVAGPSTEPPSIGTAEP